MKKIDKIRYLYFGVGMSVTDIMKKIGAARSIIYKYIKEKDFSPKPKKPFVPKPKITDPYAPPNVNLVIDTTMSSDGVGAFSLCWRILWHDTKEINSYGIASKWKRKQCKGTWEKRKRTGSTEGTPSAYHGFKR